MSKNIIGSYKGYTGSYVYDQRSDTVWGKILFINALITFESLDGTPKSLREEFESAVDDYLEDCAEEGVEPEKPAKGNFNVRITPELHLKANLYARTHETTLNALVSKALEEKLSENGIHHHHHVENHEHNHLYESPKQITQALLSHIKESNTSRRTRQVSTSNLEEASKWLN